MNSIIWSLIISAGISIELAITMYTIVILIPDRNNYEQRSIKCNLKKLYHNVFYGTNLFGKITGGIFVVLCIPGILGTVILEMIRVIYILLSNLRYKKR